MGGAAKLLALCLHIRACARVPVGLDVGLTGSGLGPSVKTSRVTVLADKSLKIRETGSNKTLYAERSPAGVC